MKHAAGLIIGVAVSIAIWSLPDVARAPLQTALPVAERIDHSPEPDTDTFVMQPQATATAPLPSLPPVVAMPTPEATNDFDNEALVESTEVETLYDTESLPLEEVNARTRSALINIFCIGSPPLKSTSGTGIILSDSGIVITNAHIGQYVLLADSGAQLSCVARRGSPAQAEWLLETIYLPPSWAEKHAHLLFAAEARGTGEDDYAFLRLVTDPSDSEPLSWLPFDSRPDALSMAPLLLAAYPAEFLSGGEVQRYLNALSTHVTAQELYTYGTSSIDALSLGPSPLAQQGSSGGALVNPWGYLIGLITTTTEGVDTGARDLRAITLGHVERSLAERGIDASRLISREPSTGTEAYTQTQEALDFLRAALP